MNVTSLPLRLWSAPALRLMCLAVALSASVERMLLAQGHSQMPASRGPGAGPAGGHAGGMGPMAPMGPGMRGPGGPQQNIPGKAVAPGIKGPPVELKINSTQLPDGFQPPGVKSELMDIDRPLAMKDEIDKLKKDLAKYQTVLRTARSTDPDKALIRSGIRYRLAVMCVKANRQDLSKLHEDLVRDLNTAASAPDAANPAAIKAFRQLVLQELVSQAVPLLTTQNFHTRLHIAMLLGELNLTEDVPRYNLKVEAYAPAIEPLIQVIANPDQPEGVKIVAVNGLARILRVGSPVVSARTKAAEVLIAELKNKKANSWYQMRLASALAAIDANDDRIALNQVNALKAVLADDERTWGVRAEAAKSLGRVPMPVSANSPTVVRAVAEFALKLAKAAQQAPQQKPDDPKWKGEFFKVYLAFQQVDANDLMADKKSKAGLLNNLAAGAKPAYDLIVPLVAAILHAQRLTAQQVQALEAWVNPSPAGQPTQSQVPPKTVTPESKGSEAPPVTVGTSGPKS